MKPPLAKIIFNMTICSLFIILTGCNTPSQPTTTISHTIESSPIEITPTITALSPSPTARPYETETPTINATNNPTTTPMPLIDGVFPGWTSYTNANYIRVLLADKDGSLWAGGSGGVTHWDIETGEYEKYTAGDGLSGNFITSIAQTVDGSVWFGTEGSGISRFDGKKWTTYTTKDGLPSDYIVSLVASSDGNLWADTGQIGNIVEAGLVLFNGKDWIEYEGGGFDVMAMTTDGTLWGGKYGHASYGNGGLYKYDGKFWVKIGDIPDNRVTALSGAPDGTLWVGTKTSIYHYDGVNWVGFTPWKNTDAIVDTIIVSPDGSVWIGLCREIRGIDYVDREELLGNVIGMKQRPPEGVYRYKAGEWTKYSVQDGLVDNEIRSIVIGDDGSVYFGSYDKGVSRLNNYEWNVYQTNDELLSNGITSIAIAEDGGIWIGYYIGSASELNGGVLHNYRHIGNLKDDKVSSISIAPDGTIWFGTFSGLASLHGETWTSYRADDYEWLGYIYFVNVITDTNLFIGTGSGALQFDGENWVNFPDFLGSGVFDIDVAPDGTRWFVTSLDGVYSFDGTKWTQYTEDNGLTTNVIRSASITPDGTVWFGTCDGIAIFDGKQWKINDQPSKLGGCVYDIAFGKGDTAWATTERGLLKYNGNSWELIPFQGMAYRRPYGIAVDANGAVWLATRGGLSKYSP